MLRTRYNNPTWEDQAASYQC
uniref:Uncharacterized protein n=1 Tax=Anguilla anguilla TaxID=7936 RepID=A0A0E9VHV1_ANGAN